MKCAKCKSSSVDLVSKKDKERKYYNQWICDNCGPTSVVPDESSQIEVEHARIAAENLEESYKKYIDDFHRIYGVRCPALPVGNENKLFDLSDYFKKQKEK